MNNLSNFQTLTQYDLEETNGGAGPLIIAAVLIGTPLVLGTIAGAADEYARKKGHR